MTMKKIMQVLPSLEQGGVEVGTLEIARALQDAKIPNIVVSNGGSMVAQLNKLGVPHIALPVHTKNPFKIWINAYRLIKVIKKENVGLVHVRSRAPAWSVWWACRKAKVPFISTYHGLYGIKPAIKKWYNSAMLKGRLVIAGSEYVKKHLMDVYHVPEEKIPLIYRGADLTRFDPDRFNAEDVIRFAEQYQISMDKPIITLVGRLSPMKGQVLLLQALAKMQHKDVTCLLVGGKATPAYERVLRKTMETLPKGITVKTISVPNSDMPLVYAVTDFVVSASLIPETFGRSVAEANAMKRMVIAFDHGGPSEIILDGKTGFLIPVGSVKMLAKTLDNVLDMPKTERDTIQKMARKRVVENFSVEKMCKKTLNIYEEILG